MFDPHDLTMLNFVSQWFLNWRSNPDTLLNVFLAIAVDNLANAQELTAAEENETKEDNEVSVIATTRSSIIISDHFN